VKIELIERRIEKQASIFKSRAIKSPHDYKRHDLIKPDEQRAMFKANDTLGWSNAKIASVFDRDRRTVAQSIKKEKRKITDSRSSQTVDETIKALTLEKLEREVKQLRSEQYTMDTGKLI
jgi:transposase